MTRTILDDHLTLSADPPPRPLASRPVVLIVDDMPDNLALLSDALDERPYRVGRDRRAMPSSGWVTSRPTCWIVMPGWTALKPAAASSCWPAPTCGRNTPASPRPSMVWCRRRHRLCPQADPAAIAARVAAHIKTARMVPKARDTDARRADRARHRRRALRQTGKVVTKILRAAIAQAAAAAAVLLNENLVLLRSSRCSLW